MDTARRYPWGESEAQVTAHARQLAQRTGADLQSAMRQIARQYGFDDPEQLPIPDPSTLEGLHWRWTGLTRRYIRDAQGILAEFRAIADLDAQGRKPYAVLGRSGRGLQLRHLHEPEAAELEFAYALPRPIHWEHLTDALHTAPFAEVHKDALQAYANRTQLASSWRLAKRLLASQMDRLIQSRPQLRPGSHRFGTSPCFPITLKPSARAAASFRCWVINVSEGVLAEISLWGTASSLWLPVWQTWSDDVRLYIAQAVSQSAARLRISLHRLDMDELLNCLAMRLREKAKRELPAYLWRDMAEADSSTPRWVVICRDPSFSGDALRIDQHLAYYCNSLEAVGDARARAEARGADDVRTMTAIEAGRLEAATVPQGAISTRIAVPSTPLGGPGTTQT